MFAKDTDLYYDISMLQMKAIEKRGRDTIRVINGRQYMERLPECASDSFNTGGTCMTDTKQQSYWNGH